MKSSIIAVTILVFTIIFSGCASDAEQKQAVKIDSDLARLTSWMSGSFSSYRQSIEDSSYYDIRLKMVPVWRHRSDAHWLYVEQAVSEYHQKPYRQRVYRVSRIDDTTYESAVYELPDPLTYAGAWKDEIPLEKLNPDSLILRQGCEIRLHPLGDSAFHGSTEEKACESTLRGASFAESEVFLTNEYLTSWDRGFDSAGMQVWGAEKDGYVFDKLYDADEIPLVMDMIALDKAYIASLALTDMGKLDKSKLALESLLSTWAVFRSNHYDYTDSQTWRDLFDLVENFFVSSAGALEAEGNPIAAHELLEQAKMPMTSLRNELNLEYYIDYLNSYHGIMVRLLESVQLKYGDRLNEIDLEHISDLTAEAQKRWQAVLIADFDPSLYSFDTEKIETLRSYREAHSKALNTLKTAIDTGDKKEVIKAVKPLKPKFARMYKLFGDDMLLSQE
jgi:CpeT protein